MLRPVDRPRRWRPVSVLLLVIPMMASALLPFGAGQARGDSVPDHLVVSEIVAGGAAASDEFVELYNPTDAPLPLEGLELVYVSASGLTVGRRAAWDAGAPELGPGRHLLIANEQGIYAALADSVYASGMAATGGSVALRIQGAASAIDAVGWGTAASTWMEASPAAAPAAGSSIERRPGGALGSTQDTDDNAADFIERAVPDPQNLASPPVPDPAGTPPPPGSPSPSPAPSVSPTPGATASPMTPPPTSAPVLSVATARSMPDGTTVTIEGTALTDSAFAEGGGYLADESAGIAVLLSSGSFERGARLRVTGTVDDRFAQRTVRASGTDVTVVGTGPDPEALDRPTGSVDESAEAMLVHVAGAVTGAPTTLSAGLAYELDDGSGPTRVVVGSGTGIDTSAWTAGTLVDLVGVVGQRDSSGTGTSGYRLQPRDPADVRDAGTPPPTAAPSDSPTPGDPGPTPAPTPEGVISISEARSLPKHATARVRGVVTMAPGLVDPVSAVIQDETGAILLRVGDEAGPVARGERIDLTGVRSTLAGMESLRLTTPPLRLGVVPEPEPRTIRSGDAGEPHEARLVRVRGAVVATARRVASGTVSFELDDGSGPLRIYLAASLAADAAPFVEGAWVEAIGVLAQQTTGSQPLRGYRIWPRDRDEVRVVAPPTSPGETDPGHASAATTSSGGAPSSRGAGHAPAGLGALEEAGLADLHVAATLVHGPWPELGLAGVLWDGHRLVVIDRASESLVLAVLAHRRLPVPLELTGLVSAGTDRATGAPAVVLGSAPGDVSVRAAAPHAPHGVLPTGGPAWVSLVGRRTGSVSEPRLYVDGGSVELRWQCDEAVPPSNRPVRALGVGLADPPRILVPCGGLQPAPALVRTGALSMPSDPAPDVAATPASVHGQGVPAEDHARMLAAGLLAAAALTAAGAATIARRLEPPPGPDTPSLAASFIEGSSGSEPPVLTLVGVPHERGSG
ncbi:MAG: lamin tail domain-containing protein [Chloroflexi bacterium]|nr:lamin tail domain-containing protein [Chloroflexota bacterium]